MAKTDKTASAFDVPASAIMYEGAPVLSHSEIAHALAATANSGVATLIQGENGIGKTAIIATLKKMPQFKNHFFPKPVDCTQLDLGDHVLYVPDQVSGTTVGYPNERYGVHRGNNRDTPNARPVVVMLDEYCKAPKHIQDGLAPLVYEQRLGSIRLPAGSLVVLTTNLSVEGLGDSLQPHIRNRMRVVTMRKPTAEEFIQYGAANDFDTDLLAFVDQNPSVMDSFIYHERDGKAGSSLASNPYIFNPYVQQLSYASPRSLESASKLLADDKITPLGDTTLLAFLTGTIGAAAARDLMSVRAFGKQVADFAVVMADPERAPLPDSAVGEIIQTYRMVQLPRSGEDAEKAMTYMKRMHEERQSLFTHMVLKLNGAGDGGTLKYFFTGRTFMDSFVQKYKDMLSM